MKTKTLIVVGIVLVVGYMLFVNKKGCKCSGLGSCTCKDEQAATTQSSAEAIKADSFAGRYENRAGVRKGTAKSMSSAYADLKS